jgi:hypothetical protein
MRSRTDVLCQQVLRARTQYERAKQDADDLARRVVEQFGAENRAIGRRRSRALAAMEAYRFTVGTERAGFFLVKAKGDTWEEVFAQLESPVRSSVTATRELTP